MPVKITNRKNGFTQKIDEKAAKKLKASPYADNFDYHEVAVPKELQTGKPAAAKTVPKGKSTAAAVPTASKATPVAATATDSAAAVPTPPAEQTGAGL